MVMILILLSGLNTNVLKASCLLENDQRTNRIKVSENPSQLPPENERNFIRTLQKELNEQEILSLINLPSEIIMYTLTFLALPDVVKFRRICHFTNQVTKAEHFDYQLKLHYGLHIGCIEPSDKSIIINYSPQGHDWFLHAPVLVKGVPLTGVENLILTKFKKQHFAAILQRSDQKSEVKIISCKNGTSWKVVSVIDSGPLLDLQLVPFRGHLWLAYIPSDTKTITLASLRKEQGVDKKKRIEKIKVNFSEARKLSLTSFKNRLYLAYATAPDAQGNIYITSSNDGYQWLKTDIHKTSWETHDCLQLISYNNKLRLAHIVTHQRAIKIGSFVNESEWLFDCQYPTPQRVECLALQAFQSRFFIISYNLGDPPSLMVLESIDGVNWEIARRLDIRKGSSLLERPLGPDHPALIK